jgi:hypothetical protein
LRNKFSQNAGKNTDANKDPFTLAISLFKNPSKSDMVVCELRLHGQMLTGQNPGKVFYYISCCMHIRYLHFYEAKLTNLKLKNLAQTTYRLSPLTHPFSPLLDAPWASKQ